MTNKLALGVAVVLGVLSIIGIRAYVERIQKQHEIDQQLIEVFVAAEDLSEGQAIDVDEDVTTVEFPGPAMQQALGDTRVKDLSTIRGSRTATPIASGRVLLEYHFRGGPDQGGHALDGKFDAPYRAMTIPIDSVAGVGGHLRPGDHIDLMVSMTFERDSETIPVTRTLFHDVLVVATGDITSPFDPMAGKGNYTTLTLRLEPQQCSKALYCLTNGGVFHALYAQPNTPVPEGKQAVVSNSIFQDIESELQRILHRR